MCAGLMFSLHLTSCLRREKRSPTTHEPRILWLVGHAEPGCETRLFTMDFGSAAEIPAAPVVGPDDSVAIHGKLSHD